MPTNPSSVELDGMTINLVEDKQTYDGMTKNPNEMYLVKNDYDIVLKVEMGQFYDPDDQITGTIVSGSIEELYDKVMNGHESGVEYVPKVLINLTAYYNTSLFVFNKICTPFVSLGGDNSKKLFIHIEGLCYQQNYALLIIASHFDYGTGYSYDEINFNLMEFAIR